MTALSTPACTSLVISLAAGESLMVAGGVAAVLTGSPAGTVASGVGFAATGAAAAGATCVCWTTTLVTGFSVSELALAQPFSKGSNAVASNRNLVFIMFTLSQAAHDRLRHVRLAGGWEYSGRSKLFVGRQLRRETTSIAALFLAMLSAGRTPRQLTPG